MTFAGRHDDLVDRYGRPNLYAAAAQLVVLVVVLLYAFTLGSRCLVPLCVILPPWAVLIWLTLYKPWDPSWDWSWPSGMLNRRFSVWDPGVLLASTLLLASCHRTMISYAKDKLAKLEIPMDSVEALMAGVMGRRDWVPAWQDDTVGKLVVMQAVDVSMVFPALIVSFCWFFLPK